MIFSDFQNVDYQWVYSVENILVFSVLFVDDYSLIIMD